jgi:hypothetical protein
MRKITKTYVLVGNHDYINNQQFLTNNHWMNGLKEWNNTIIVDNVIKETINNEKFIFVPYVPPGRFEEALRTLKDDWISASCIFAHQEFAGCKMGAIVSIEGDKWDINNPIVISGHIHSKQQPQKNIYYSGSAMQHAFGEKDQYNLEEIDLELPRKKIVYMNVEEIDTYNIPETEDQIKVTLKGDYNEFKAVKKTKKYKNLVDKGVKVVFKPQKEKVIQNNTEEKVESNNTTDTSFNKILSNIINEQKNPYLLQSYELIINGKEMKIEDVLFL